MRVGDFTLTDCKTAPDNRLEKADRTTV